MDGLYLLGFGPRTATRGARACGTSLSGHLRVRGRTRRRCCAVRPMTAATQPAGVRSTECPACAPHFSRGGHARALVAVLLAVASKGASIGPAEISLGRIAAALFAGGGDPLTVDRDQIILKDNQIASHRDGIDRRRAITGAGAVMQGLFRNPLADPGLVGVSAGAGLAAAAAIVAGDKAAPSCWPARRFLLPITAFCGALATTAMLYRMATWEGRTSIATMLLAGRPCARRARRRRTGLLVFLADDRSATSPSGCSVCSPERPGRRSP